MALPAFPLTLPDPGLQEAGRGPLLPVPAVLLRPEAVAITGCRAVRVARPEGCHDDFRGSASRVVGLAGGERGLHRGRAGDDRRQPAVLLPPPRRTLGQVGWCRWRL